MTLPGEHLPPRQRTLSARDIISGAIASRDWQPQHHDHGHALAMNLSGIIMNAPTQTGWFHGYAMQWAGERARIGRWRLKMLRPLCPGMTVHLSGQVTRTLAPGWVWLDLRMDAADERHSAMQLLLCRPVEPDFSCWETDDWTCPPLD